MAALIGLKGRGDSTLHNNGIGLPRGDELAEI